MSNDQKNASDQPILDVASEQDSQGNQSKATESSDAWKVFIGKLVSEQDSEQVRQDGEAQVQESPEQKNPEQEDQEAEPRALLDFWGKWYMKIQDNQGPKPEALDLWFISLAYHLISRIADPRVQQGSQRLQQFLELEVPRWRRFSSYKLRQELNDKEDRKHWEELRRIAREEKERDIERGRTFQVRDKQSDVVSAVNAAIYLRRPLLITGKPGSGKTSLAYAVAYELNLGPVLLWPVTARSTLREALYQYDAIARLQDAQLSQKPSPPTEPAPSEQSASEQGGDQQSKESSPKASITDYRNIGQYIRLGPVGTAFLPSKLPRLLLIDEIDKSDINLPNDLLNLFEEGSYKIPELVRLARQGNESQTVQSEDGVDVKINQGQVQCYEFPIVLMTSNGERDFPPAFYRRCLRVEMPDPDVTELKEIVKAHLGEEIVQEFEKVILNFDDKNQSTESGLATDQLLNTVYLLKQKADEETITRLLFQSLSPTEKGS